MMRERYRLTRSLGVSRRRALRSALPIRFQAAYAALRGETVIYRARFSGNALDLHGPGSAFLAENEWRAM